MATPRREFLSSEPEQQHRRQQNQRHRQQLGDGIAGQEGGETGGDEPARLVEHEERQSLHDEHRREGDHDRLQAQKGDEEAIEGAGRDADADPGEAPQQDRSRIVLHVRGKRDVDQRDDGTRREIEAAGEDHERFAHGRDRERRAAAREEADLEVGDRPGADPIDDEKQNDEDGDRDQEAAMAAEPQTPHGAVRGAGDAGGRHHAACSSTERPPPRVARMIASSLSAWTPISSTTRPPYMISTRSARLTSSGISVE